MYKNYETRVKDFIIDMNNPETKIKIKDYEEKIINPKTDMSEEKGILKPFIFKGYTTEEDRIKDSVKKNRYLFNLPDYDDILIKNHKASNNKKINSSFDNTKDNNINYKTSEKKKIRKININKNFRGLSKAEINRYKYILKNDLIIQPEMRFKPRTDLERVYDIINEYKYGRAKKGILNKQLKNIDLFKYKNKKELNDLIKGKIKSNDDKNLTDFNDSYERINYSHIEDLNKKNKLYFNPKKIDYNLKPWIKRDDLNIDAYKILTSYHYKTHFKAAKEVAANKTHFIENNDLNQSKNNDNNYKSQNKINNNEKKSCLLLPNLFKKKYIISKSATEGNNLLENTQFDLNNKNKNLIDIKIDKEIDEIFNCEPDNEEDNKSEFNDIYIKNKNPFIKKIIFDENKIKILNDIAFQKNKDNESLVKEDNGTEEAKAFFNEKNLDDNNIIIGKEKLDKNNQFDIITNKILESCNILKHKSKFNNITHKKRDGKLMITHGLSIDEFEKKYEFKNK